MIETLENLSKECGRLLALTPKTEENSILRFCLYQLESAAYIHADLLQSFGHPFSYKHIKEDLVWQQVILDKLVELRKKTGYIKLAVQ